MVRAAGEHGNNRQRCNYAIISATRMSWREIFIGKMQRREGDSHSIETARLGMCGSRGQTDMAG